jgi:hypothetical protein
VTADKETTEPPKEADTEPPIVEAEAKQTSPQKKSKKSTPSKSTSGSRSSTSKATKAKPKTQPTKTVATAPTKAVTSKPEVEPVPLSKPAVETSSGPTGKIVFEKQGSVDSIYLIGSNGKKYKSGSNVPVGNYTIKIKCSGSTSDAQKHSVKANKTSTYACNCMMRSCQSK